MILRRRIMAAVLFSWLILVLAAACADTVTLPDELKTIGAGAFQGDSSLDEVIIPDGVEEIPANAFANSGVKKIFIPDSVISIISSAFDKLKEVLIIATTGSYAAEYATEAEGFNYSFEIVEFGKYPQGANGEVSPIEWIVLKKEGNRALLLSRYILDYQPFHKSNSTWVVVDNWQSASVRTWLNWTFRNSAFTVNEEQKVILETEVNNSASENSQLGGGNIFSCENTREKIFLLSYREAKIYFPNDKQVEYEFPETENSAGGISEISINAARAAAPTAYAQAKGLEVDNDWSGEMAEFNGKGYWWLRSQFNDKQGWIVSGEGRNGSRSYPTLSNAGIRPAIWVDLNAMAALNKP